MKVRPSHVAFAALLAAAPPTKSALVSGFEAGLVGWDYMGDVSIQTSAIGISPTQGQSMVFISTMCDRDNPPAQVRPDNSPCMTTVNEHPYSGTSSPWSGFAREFIGLPFGSFQFSQSMPRGDPGIGGNTGESGAIKTSFFAP